MPDRISIVSPVYGCTGCLDALCRKVREAFEGSGLDWELVLVDDRGPDDPWPLICELARKDARIRGVRLSRSHGQHLAIWAGLAKARGDWVAVLDCDLQDDPALIPTLHQAALARDTDAIVVDRGSWSDSWFRRAASRAFYRIIELLGGISIQNVGNFGLYSRRMVDTLLLYGEQEVFLPMMIALTGLKRDTYRLDRSARAAGSSSYTFMRLLRMAAAILIRFSDRPLKLSVVVGFAFSLFAALISLLLTVLWLFGIFTVPGWTSTILSVWFLSGLIMATLGVHGFYLGRVFAEVKQRPRIIVESTTATPADDRSSNDLTV
jgi:dolichol-phosphate mannosyltransferase